MPKVYSGPHQDFYRVWEKADKSLVIEVLHSNKSWRNRLLGSNPHVHTLLHDVCTPKENKIRAAAILFEVIQDFPEAFRHGRVAFTAKHSYLSPLTPAAKPPDVASVIRSPSSTAQYQHQPWGAGAGSTTVGVLDPLVGRAFFYHEIYRLRSILPEALTRNAGLYAVLQQDEILGHPINGLLPDTQRYVKIGMSDVSVKTRILSQYFGKSQRTAILRQLVGDALIGRAMREQHDLAGFPSTSLCDVRMLWNAGGSPSRAIQCQHGIARKYNLFTARDLTDFESALEGKVTTYMNDFRFIALSANPEDVSQIEDAANSLLRDVAAVDPASVTWLGHSSSREAVRQYGLWATVGVTRKYRPYTEHEWKLKGRDDQGHPVADWLLLLRELIDKELTTGL